MNAVQQIKCGSVNCYLVSNGQNAILVDTGKKENLNKVLAACQPYEMKLIVLTHAHFDHAENALALSEKWNVPIAMHKEDCCLIDDNRNQSLTARTFLGKCILAASLSEFERRKLPQFKPSVYLSEGDELSKYGINAHVIELPGHTSGSIGIDVEGEGIIVGDAMMNMFYPTVSMLYHDEAKMIESARKIKSLGERIIYFGHGKPKKSTDVRM